MMLRIITQLPITLLCISFSFLLITTNLTSQDSPLVILNEVSYTSPDDVFIELLVLGKSSNPCGSQTPKEVNLILDDIGTGNLMEPGYLEINRHCLVDAKMGELIIIYGKDTDVSQSESRFKFRIDDPCIQKWEGYPNLSEDTYYGGTRVLDSNAKITDFISFGGNGDIIQLRTRDAVIQSFEQDNSFNYSLGGGIYDSYTIEVPSPALTNNNSNKSFVNGVIVAGKKFTVVSEVIDAGNTATPIENDIKLSFCSGTPPYSVRIPSVNRVYENVSSTVFIVHDVPCGNHHIEVVDSKNDIASTDVTINPVEKIFISGCVGKTLMLPYLSCLNIDKKCYAWYPESLFTDLPDGNKTEIPELILPTSPQVLNITLKISDGQGNIVGEYEITIDVHDDEDGDGLCGSADPDDKDRCNPLNNLNMEIQDIENPEFLQKICSNDSKELTTNYGNEDFEFTWSNGDNTAIATIFDAGKYGVTVTDDKGCKGSSEIIIYEYQTPEVLLDPNYIICEDGEAVLTVEGESLYQYVWDNGLVSQSRVVSQSGEYKVTVSNYGVCETVLSTTVNSSNDCCLNSDLAINISGSTIVCEGGVAEITVKFIGGDAPYKIQQSDKFNKIEQKSLSEYIVFIPQGNNIGISGSDANECSTEQSNVEIDINSNGDTLDTDEDGICDSLDEDPNDPCTPYLDSDGDGVCDAIDCDPDIAGKAIGYACDDDNNCTSNDKYNEDCICTGIPIPDCNNCIINSPCDDGNDCTTNDVVIENCQCEGIEIPFCADCTFGAMCDDGNPCTYQDVIGYGCDCAGVEMIDGNACDDLDPCTTNEVFVDCQCVGEAIEVGLVCDDGDLCTENDQYDEDCNCIGESILDFEILTDIDPCSESYGALWVDYYFDDIEWKLNGRTISTSVSCSVFESGRYEVSIVNGECANVEYIDILDLTKPNIDISSSEDFICSSANPVTLSIDEEYSNITWYDPLGNELDNEAEQKIYYAGLYTVTANNSDVCQLFGEIEIEPLENPELRLESESIVICDGFIKIEIIGLEEPAEVEWSGPDFTVINAESISAYTSGVYSALISFDNNQCEIFKEIEITDGSDNEELTALLLDNGFEEQRIQVVEFLAQSEEENDYKSVSACENFSDLTGTNYTGVTFLDIVLEDNTNLTLDNLNGEIASLVCNTETCESSGAIIMNSICEDTESNLEYLLSYGGEYNSSMQVYVMHDDVSGEPIKLFTRVSKKNELCDNVELNPDLFVSFTNDLICAISNKLGDNLDFVLTNISNAPNFNSGWIKLFDNKIYTGEDGISDFNINVKNNAKWHGISVPDNFYDEPFGFFVFNYKQGENLNISEREWVIEQSHSFDICGFSTFIFDDARALKIRIVPLKMHCTFSMISMMRRILRS